MEALFDTSILSWNIRGAQNNTARRHLKDLIRRFTPTFFAILETHVPFARLSNFWSNNGYSPVHIIEASGHSGGIWLLKHTSSNITSTVLHSNQYSLTFSITRGTATTTCTSVYASPNPTLRLALWNYLSNISHSIAGPWMLIGDFNEILLPGDQRGGIFHQNRAALFANFMGSCNLLDLTTIGGRFTWHRNHNGIRILSKKLDRGLANMNWRLSFPEAIVDVPCRLHSDHNPLLLRFGGLPLNRGTRPFRFEAACIDHPEYMNLVNESWNSSNHNTILALKTVQKNLQSSTKRCLVIFSKEKSTLKVDSRVFKTTSKEWILQDTLFSKKNSSKNRTTFFSKKKCTGIKNLERNGYSLGTKIALSSTPKLSFEERKTESTNSNSLLASGPPTKILFKRKPKISSKTS
jgi:hypothetical protein